jgi:serine/threonine-protein kinase
MMKAAVKVLDPATRGEVDEQALRDRFRTEASALANLDHPNIVRLIKYGGDFEPPYLAMEYVEGVRTLTQELDIIHKSGKRTLDPETVRHILCQILWALSAAHDKGIVHLDLRPENIALQDPIGYGNFVRLLDFGLAAYLDRIHEEELAMGTAEYIAPERILMGQTGPSTDLYAIGVLAFDLLAGRSLFRELSLDEIVAQKQDPKFNPASLLKETRYPPFVLSFFKKALAFDPDDRYRTAEEFLARLRPVVSFFEE